MKTVNFITSNPHKFQIAREILRKRGIEVIQEELETPEIQSDNVVEISSFSAKWAANKLNKPVVLTDAGYYIEALNGFPGPFIKYINKWLTSADLLRLMEGKENRNVIVKTCLAYCEPGKDPKTFLSEIKGKIAHKAEKVINGWVTSINEIFIPEGFDRVASEIPSEEMVKFWARGETYWEELADFLLK